MSALETITTAFVWGLAAFTFPAGLFIPLMIIGVLMALPSRRS